MLRTIFLSNVAVWVIVIDVEKYFSSLMLRNIFLLLLIVLLFWTYLQVSYILNCFILAAVGILLILLISLLNIN